MMQVKVSIGFIVTFFGIAICKIMLRSRVIS